MEFNKNPETIGTVERERESLLKDKKNNLFSSHTTNVVYKKFIFASNNTGITLVALVVTIITMLILARCQY